MNKVRSIKQYLINKQENNLENFEQYLLKDKLLSDNTAKGYLNDMRLFIAWANRELKGFAPEKIIPYDVKTFLNHDNKLPSTKNRRLSAIKNYFDFLIDMEQVTNNPCHKIKPFKKSKINLEKKWLTKREQQQLIYEVEKVENEALRARDLAIIRIFLNCGLRLDELQELKLEDVDLVAGTIKVTKGKGEKYRVQTINTEKQLTLKAIKEWLKYRQNTGEYLFNTSRSDKISRRTLQTLVEKYGEKANLGKVSPHQLRHSCGKNLADAGYPIEFIAEILGHESIETTRIYITPDKHEIQMAASKTEQ